MASYIDPAFRESILKRPQDRTAQDLTLINANLKSLEALSSLRDTTIRSLCKTVRYEKHEANDVLYRTEDVISCWYILLSGSVFIDGSMFLPRSGFGRRTASQTCRIHDCLVLETSEMLVIDYPSVKTDQSQASKTHHLETVQISTKIKTGSHPNSSSRHHHHHLIHHSDQPKSGSTNNSKANSIQSHTTSQNRMNHNEDNSGLNQTNQTNKTNFLNVNDTRGRVCPIVSGNSSASSLSNSTHSNANNNLTTFKNLATSGSNSPIISINNVSSITSTDSTTKPRRTHLDLNSHLHPDLHSSNLSSVGSTNEEDSREDSSSHILNNHSNRSDQSIVNKIDLDDDLDDDDLDDEPSLNQLNSGTLDIEAHEPIISSNYSVAKAAVTDNNYIEEYNSQIKSICIITGNPSFKSSTKPSHLRTDRTQQNFSGPRQKPEQVYQSHLRIQNAYDVSQQDLDLSQQTLNSNSNANNSVNTIDTLDIEDLRDLNNDPNLNSSTNKVNGNMPAQNNQDLQHLTSISTSINSLNSIVPTNMTATATTISISGSIGDDASATSEQSLQMIKDSVREVLEKDPKERSDDDIDVLFEFMQSFSAFSELTQPIIRRLCACMVLGVVDKADTLVLDHNEKLDSWAVVLSGHVECILPDSSIKSYQIGDHFGVDATLDPVYHEGIMRTRCEDCQFVLVKQNDYYEILNKSKENLNSHTENGKLVLITEQRPLNNSTEKTGEIVLKGSLEKLVERLVCDDSYSIVDPTYIQDFLLTYRVFIENPTYISNKLFEWFQMNKVPSYLTQYSPTLASREKDNQNGQNVIKKKVYRIVLEWITNHFNDFETNKDLYDFVEKFQDVLSKEKMVEQFRVLTIAISTKSKLRTLTLARSKRDETLMFNIQGGWDKGYGIFVSHVDKDSKAYEIGIRKGDQILDVNGHSFQHILHANALEMIKSFTHLSIKLKYNPIGFNEMLLHPEKSPHRNKKNIINNNKAYLIEYLQMQQNQFQQGLNSDSTDSKVNGQVKQQNDSLTTSATNSILDHLQTNQSGTLANQTKKSIGSIPPLPPTALSTQTPRNKSKADKNNLKSSNGTNSNSNSNLMNQHSNSNQIRKILGRFNRKAHSKDFESLQPNDSSAPALKSITRSPSPSLANPFSHNFNRSHTTTSINQMDTNTMSTSISTDYSTMTSRANSSNSNLNMSGDCDPQNNSNLSSSLASMNLQDQQQFVGEHVLKIYKNDQNFKYLVVHKETSVKEVVMLSLNEFNIVDDIGSNAYSLCEVSVDQDRLIKQKRLPDQMNNLAEKLPLNARYYLKSNVNPEQFLSDSFAAEELIKDANISFLQLDPLELSAQLTLRDYCIFKSIESSEYVDYLFKKNSKYGFSHLNQFSDLSNEEMFWVVNEILHESNLVKRAKIIKHFIQIAHICKECKNFNSLLAILSGLDHLSVTRLKDTWDKVSSKYKKILQELRILLDTTRNMFKYRQLLKSETIQPPIIPFFPICQKDLYFIKESGDTMEDGLINFDKLRKMAKGVRSIVQMTASSFDLTSLRDVPTSHSVIFSMFGCTSSSLIEFRSGYQFTKLNIKQDHVKKLYEEAVMVRKVRHYLNNISKNIEKNEERLRLISSTLEHSTSVNTLRRKPSPNSSLGGSVSSINGLNNSHNAHNISNGSSIGAGQKSALFGTHSPDAVKKLLSLSETKVKTVKGSVSSTSVPLSHLSNSRLLNTSNTSASSNLSSHNIAIGNMSPSTPLSPKTKHRSISSSQPLNKYNYSIPLSSESSSVSTIKLGKYTSDPYSTNQNSSTLVHNLSNSQNVMHISSISSNGGNHSSMNNIAMIKSNGAAVHIPAVSNSEADSGRASMASNNDQDQCSPTFQQRAFVLNRYMNNEQSTSQTYKMTCKVQVNQNNQQYSKQTQEMLINQGKTVGPNNNHFNKASSDLLHPQNSLEEEEDQVSAV